VGYVDTKSRVAVSGNLPISIIDICCLTKYDQIINLVQKILQLCEAYELD
jgi:hypothetical protein